MEVYLKKFLTWLKLENYAAKTIHWHEKRLLVFFNWSDAKSITDVTVKTLESYQRYLHGPSIHQRHSLRQGSGQAGQGKKAGKNLSLENQMRHLTSVKLFFKFLLKKNHILIDPAEDIELPKMPGLLPKDILTPSEVKKILSLPDVKIPLGLRARAIFEILNATGMRAGELRDLRTSDIDFTEKSIFIRDSKNNADRLIPVSDRALDWVERYLKEARVKLVSDRSDDFLFLTYTGRKMHKSSLASLMERYFKKANIKKRGGVYLFRHTIATRMLDNGADIRYIQKMLGHVWLQTTQIYTKVSIEKLKEMHRKTHPAEMKKI